MADTESMNISEGTEHLISVEFDEELRDALLHLDVVAHHPVNCFWDIIHNNIEVDLILLVASGIEGMLHLNDVGVEQLFHDLQLSVLIPLVLINLFDCYSFSCLSNSSLVNDTKRPVTNYSFSIVSKGSLVALLILFFLCFALYRWLKIW